MSNYFNFDGIKTELEKEIDINRAFLDAWKNVSFPVKKDGKPFSVLSKNIDGAKLTACAYAMQAGENELTVYTRSARSGYIHDTIKLYDIVRYMKDAEMLAKTENYMPKQNYLEQIYKYDLDDIKNAVKARIEYLEEYISDLENQLSASLRVLENFRAAYDAAIKTLEADTAEFSHKNLFYAVKDTVLARYPYI